MSHRESLLIRADAGPGIGTGHVMRCMALAQAWRDLGRTVAFLSWELPNSLAVRLDAEGFHLFGLNDRPGSTNDAAQATELAHQIGAKWIVVDGYQFGSGYQEAIRSDGVHQLFVDDNGHAGSYSADVVLNQNAHAHDGFYWNRCPQTSLLLGPRYALLRNEFWRWRGWQRETAPVATNILVTMGGADSQNITSETLRALAEIDDGQLVVKALVGVSNPNLAQIQNCVEQSKVHIKLVNSTRDMAALMAWADLAISAAGSTSLELAFMQVPVGSIVIADNQRQAAERMNDDRLAILLGDTRSWHKDQAVKSIARLIESKELREELAARGRNLVDGLGVSRIMSTMTAN